LDGYSNLAKTLATKEDEKTKFEDFKGYIEEKVKLNFDE